MKIVSDFATGKCTQAFHAATWMNFEDILLSERSQTHKRTNIV